MKTDDERLLQITYNRWQMTHDSWSQMMTDDWKIMTFWLIKIDWLLMAMTIYEWLQQIMTRWWKIQHMTMDDGRWQQMTNDNRWRPMTNDKIRLTNYDFMTDETWLNTDGRWQKMTKGD